MKTLWKRILICCCLAAAIWVGSVISDRNALRESIIRLHVVANSDSHDDQTLKLQVRDAVLNSIREDLQTLGDISAARSYLQENLPKIQSVAQTVLKQAGIDQQAVVTLCREPFGQRIYDTFTLPSGVYEALRITIGEGEGKNWWCVAFPALCQSATTEEFSDAAVSAGFSQPLTGSITGRKPYRIRFFLLDKLGQLENKLFSR